MKIVIPSHQKKMFSITEQDHDVTIIVQSGAQLLCIDERICTGKRIASKLQIIAKESSQIIFCDKRSYEHDAKVMQDIQLQAHRDSVIRFEQLLQDAQNIDTKITAQVCEQNGEIILASGMILAASQRYSIQTIQHHRAPNAKTNCSVKAIVPAQGQALYEGMIQIDRGAQLSEAFQNHKALLLDDSAYAYARPSLQVETDDVQCGHGSAIGQLDAEHQQYLYARGIAPQRTQELLLHAFMNDLYSSETMKEYI